MKLNLINQIRYTAEEKYKKQKEEEERKERKLNEEAKLEIIKWFKDVLMTCLQNYKNFEKIEISDLDRTVKCISNFRNNANELGFDVEYNYHTRKYEIKGVKKNTTAAYIMEEFEAKLQIAKEKRIKVLNREFKKIKHLLEKGKYTNCIVDKRIYIYVKINLILNSKFEEDYMSSLLLKEGLYYGYSDEYGNLNCYIDL